MAFLISIPTIGMAWRGYWPGSESGHGDRERDQEKSFSGSGNGESHLGGPSRTEKRRKGRGNRRTGGDTSTVRLFVARVTQLGSKAIT